MYELVIRVAVEILSASMCFILLWFMIKPYSFTREGRYLGLPVGFAFLGVSYVVSAVSFSLPDYFLKGLAWFQLLDRTFAFVFIAITYYFSGKSSKSSRIIWDITYSMLIIALAALIMLAVVVPQFSDGYRAAQVYARALNLLCIVYVAIHTLRTHIRFPEPSTIWIPIGFVMLGISQYSLIIWAIDASLFAFWGSLVLRLTALTLFLFVSWKAFEHSKETGSQ
jgi:hypothetical protein